MTVCFSSIGAIRFCRRMSDASISHPMPPATLTEDEGSAQWQSDIVDTVEGDTAGRNPYTSSQQISQGYDENDCADCPKMFEFAFRCVLPLGEHGCLWELL